MVEKPRLFGTDGMRGVAGRFPLDAETVSKTGRALGAVLTQNGRTGAPSVVLGEDTRESSAGIARALAAGLHATGVEVAYAGVITTPGIAYLARRHGFDAGVVISASHNPFEDNGIKILSREGTKLAESVELEIESRMAEANPVTCPATLDPSPDLVEHYVEHLCGLVPAGFDYSSYRLVVDCANGAASRVAPALFGRLGIRAEILHAAPDGRNVNRDCGALYPEKMAATTRRAAADLGVAFDGDADRAIFALCDGRIADGDFVLYAAANYLQDRGALRAGAVVGTVMSNLGLEVALGRRGIGLKRTAVGDKYVLEEMLRSGSNLGGEPSGHIIFADRSLAGDGLVTLLEMLRIIRETGQGFAEIVSGLKPFPQRIRNLRVREKPPLEAVAGVGDAIAACRSELGERGRVVVRYSGTEPVARVMVEADSAELVERHVTRIADAIAAALGTGGRNP
jgi:phosphoglucosamine mutase